MPNPGLSRTRPYPFARLRKLFEGIVPAEGKLEPISLGIGEPCHPIPQCIGEAIAQNISLMSSYPGTAGNPALREAISAWCERRYGLAPDRCSVPAKPFSVWSNALSTRPSKAAPKS